MYQLSHCSVNQFSDISVAVAVVVFLSPLLASQVDRRSQRDDRIHVYRQSYGGGGTVLDRSNLTEKSTRNEFLERSN